ncbi:polymorphic toxin-type HINT domain-containing protein [Saccharopolyspora gregorii]|uniref:Hint domain-containing protein n=1 Tax=Saccharopolyspora gregorii TaxID=33914 RepID=A0ABP6RQ15_9PSEU
MIRVVLAWVVTFLLVVEASPAALARTGQAAPGGGAERVVEQIAAVDQRLAALPARQSALAAQETALDARANSYNQRSKDVLARLDAVSAQIDQHNAVVRGYPNGAPLSVADSMNARAASLNSQLAALKSQAGSIATEGDAIQSARTRLEAQQKRLAEERGSLAAQRRELLGGLAAALITAIEAPPTTVPQAAGGDPARPSSAGSPREPAPGGDRTSRRSAVDALDDYARTRRAEVDARPITATLSPQSVARTTGDEAVSLPLRHTFDGLVRKPGGTYKGLTVAAPGRPVPEAQKSFERAVEHGGAVAERDGRPITVDEVEQVPAGAADDECPTRNSFAPGTRVLLADGRSRAIEQLEAGDLVLAADPASGRDAVEPVSRLITGFGVKRLNRLTIAAGSGRGTLTATAEHPFWDPVGRTWVRADELGAATSLATPRGFEPVRVVGNEPVRAVGTVYNLAIAGTHTFYALAGKTPVLVHNSGCGPIPLGGSDLAQMAKRHRAENSVSPGSNIAVFEYETGAGPGYLTTKNRPGRHSEGIIDDYIRKSGIDPASVTRIYSERVPCSMRGFDCAIVVGKYPRAEVSFSLSGTRRQNFADLERFMRDG